MGIYCYIRITVIHISIEISIVFPGIANGLLDNPLPYHLMLHRSGLGRNGTSREGFATYEARPLPGTAAPEDTFSYCPQCLLQNKIVCYPSPSPRCLLCYGPAASSFCSNGHLSLAHQAWAPLYFHNRSYNINARMAQ